MNEAESKRILISTDELAERWGISINTVRAWVCQRRIPYHKVGRLVKFHIGSLEGEWLKVRRIDPIKG